MNLARDTFCSYCGTRYAEGSRYPRTCAGCNTQVWANPLPVCVVLVPVMHEGRIGLLVVRRGIEPGKGRLALVGGFLEEHESWQAGAAREVREETGVIVDANALASFWFGSSAPNPKHVMLFSVAPTMDARSLPPQPSCEETADRGLIFGPDGIEDVFVFHTHIAAARRYFEANGITGPVGFVSV